MAASTLRGLALSCHPGPTVAVTALTTALAIGTGNTAGTVLLIGLTVLIGQLSIGWSNDWIDAGRDTAVRRADKPIAAGAVGVGIVRRAAFIALAVAAGLSATLGWRAGLVHLVAVVGSGWVYNLGVKSSPWSWLPYVVCFGLLPAVPTLSLPGHSWAPAWALGAGALLGFGAHLANVLPDLIDDARTGVRGFPHRLGRTGSALTAPAALLGATVLVVLGPAGAATVLGRVGLSVALGLAGIAAVIGVRRPGSRLPFQLTIGVAAVDVLLLVAAGSQLS